VLIGHGSSTVSSSINAPVMEKISISHSLVEIDLKQVVMRVSRERLKIHLTVTVMNKLYKHRRMG